MAEFGRLEKARLWRRKFLWFAASKRPAYYGSWSAARCTKSAMKHCYCFVAVNRKCMTLRPGAPCLCWQQWRSHGRCNLK